jgi:kinesin family protein 18/19
MKQYSDDYNHNRVKSNANGEPNNKDTKGDLSFLDHYANNNFDGFELTKETKQQIEEYKHVSNNILVAIRVRPLNSKELAISNFETIKIVDQKIAVLLDPANEFEPQDVFRNQRNREKQYAYDFAFDTECSTNMIYQCTTEIQLEGILNGYNATVFAYGATGAGKTFTMMGHNDKPGLMMMTLNALYAQLQQNSAYKDFTVKVSYLEVYNEAIRDLLSAEDTNLDLREDPEKGVCVAGISEFEINSTQEVLGLLKVGNKNRIMESTGANVASSRSHAVLQIVVETKNKGQGTTEEVTMGKLCLIDLAGSERAATTNNKGLRLQEGANINKSLLALGNCITMLSESTEKGIKGHYIPYRDSKLTRLLKDSLGGNCRTVMIANVSPAVSTFEDTHNTLKYANRAKNIKTKSVKNVLNVQSHIAQYSSIITSLKQENENLKRLINEQKNGSAPAEIRGGGGKGGGGGSNNGNTKTFNEKLHNEITQHFDKEVELKKAIFDLDDALDQHFLKQAAAGMEPKITDQQKGLQQKLDQNVKEFNGCMQQRNGIYAKIQQEKNSDSAAYLNSIFKQYQLHIENQDFQHKEKKAENQIKAKELEIVYLQNQLKMRDEVLKDQKGGSSNGKAPLKDLSSPNIKIIPGNLVSPKNQASNKNNDNTNVRTNLPALNQRIQNFSHNYVPPRQQNAVSPQQKRIFNDNSGVESPEVMMKVQPKGGSSPPRYYLHKDLILRDKEMNNHSPDTRKHRSPNSKRKYGINSHQTMEQNHTSTTERHINKGSYNTKSHHIHRPIPLTKMVMGNARNRYRANSKGSNDSNRKHSVSADVSFNSTASNSDEHKRGLLKQLNSKSKQSLPPILDKAKVLHAHGLIQERYKESPYVRKFNEKDEMGMSHMSHERMKDYLHGSPVSKFFSKGKNKKNKNNFFD